MRKLLVASMIAGIALAGVASPAYAAQPSKADKVGYCHATHSDKNPYVYIVTSQTAADRAHNHHQDGEDIIPATPDCVPYDISVL